MESPIATPSVQIILIAFPVLLLSAVAFLAFVAVARLSQFCGVEMSVVSSRFWGLRRG